MGRGAGTAAPCSLPPAPMKLNNFGRGGGFDARGPGQLYPGGGEMEGRAAAPRSPGLPSHGLVAEGRESSPKTRMIRRGRLAEVVLRVMSP